MKTPKGKGGAILILAILAISLIAAYTPKLGPEDPQKVRLDKVIAETRESNARLDELNAELDAVNEELLASNKRIRALTAELVAENERLNIPPEER